LRTTLTPDRSHGIGEGRIREIVPILQSFTRDGLSVGLPVTLQLLRKMRSPHSPTIRDEIVRVASIRNRTREQLSNPIRGKGLLCQLYRARWTKMPVKRSVCSLEPLAVCCHVASALASKQS
jgi:hypothetical protein